MLPLVWSVEFKSHWGLGWRTWRRTHIFREIMMPHPPDESKFHHYLLVSTNTHMSNISVCLYFYIKTCTRNDYKGIYFSIPNLEHPKWVSSVKWINHEISIQWNILQQQKTNYWYTQQHIWISSTCCWNPEAKHRREYVVRFYLCEF